MEGYNSACDLKNMSKNYYIAICDDFVIHFLALGWSAFIVAIATVP